MRLVVDVENTITELDKNKLDMSPFRPNNKLVSVGVLNVDTGECDYLFFYHELSPIPAEVNKRNRNRLNQLLSSADMVIGHNIKHDLMWLKECGFDPPDKTYDTMIAEYVLNRGINKDLSLYGLSVAKNLRIKKSALIEEALDNGVLFSQIPIDVVEEYGIGDLYTTLDLYNWQQEEYSREVNQPLLKTRDMMMAMCSTLVDMERNGIKIDITKLEEIDKEYEAEQIKIQKRLNEIVSEVMGDTPINLNSPEQLNWVLYSRSVKDKKTWAEIFRIGTDERGKPLYRPKMSPQEFIKKVKENTSVVYRTKAEQCSDCGGKGTIVFVKKDGSVGKRTPKCLTCSGKGILYHATNKVAGLKFTPSSILDTAQAGFATDKETINVLSRLPGVSDIAKEFVTLVVRNNAIDTYRSSFVNGIRRGAIPPDNIIHPKFNQCITATGRLSSSDPNFQNQPRGSTFPVKAAFISRFPNGKIFEADYRQLEFRVAGILSNDKNIANDVLKGVDVHSRTSSILTEAGQPTNRQGAKSHTFKPLYGGMSGTQAEIAYYTDFLKMYPDLSKWHNSLLEEVMSTGMVTIMSGRQYAFPGTRRTASGGVTNATKIKNYPVQGFATADIVPIGNIILRRMIDLGGYKMLPINTVHDSCSLDVPEDEYEEAAKVLTVSLLGAQTVAEAYYNVKFSIPLDIEVKCGYNSLETKEIDVEKFKSLPLEISWRDIIYTL